MLRMPSIPPLWHDAHERAGGKCVVTLDCGQKRNADAASSSNDGSAGMFEDAQPDLGQSDAAGRAIEQTHAKLVFQQRDASAGA